MATSRRYWSADVSDPVIGETATLAADSAVELDRLVDEHLDAQ
jgi:hypothetical protein